MNSFRDLDVCFHPDTVFVAKVMLAKLNGDRDMVLIILTLWNAYKVEEWMDRRNEDFILECFRVVPGNHNFAGWYLCNLLPEMRANGFDDVFRLKWNYLRIMGDTQMDTEQKVAAFHAMIAQYRAGPLFCRVERTIQGFLEWGEVKEYPWWFPAHGMPDAFSVWVPQRLRVQKQWNFLPHRLRVQKQSYP